MVATADMTPIDSLEGELAAVRDHLFRYSKSVAALVHQQRRPLESDDCRKQALDQIQTLEETFQAEKQLFDKLENTHYETALALTQAVDRLGGELPDHLEKIGRLAAFLAAELGASEEDANILLAAAPLMDVGKIGIPDSYLSKPGPLDQDEWEVVKSHTVLGGKILSGSSSPLVRAGRAIALTHHERWDGSGYPRGLSKRDIPLFGHIVSLVDRYYALRSERPYKPAFDHATTCAILLEGNGRTEPRHFAPFLLEKFRNGEGIFEAIFDSESSSLAAAAAT